MCAAAVDGPDGDGSPMVQFGDKVAIAPPNDSGGFPIGMGVVRDIMIRSKQRPSSRDIVSSAPATKGGFSKWSIATDEKRTTTMSLLLKEVDSDGLIPRLNQPPYQQTGIADCLYWL